MEYTIIMNGRSYDLPKKTVAVMESLDTVLKVDAQKGLTLKQKFEKLHSFTKNLLGEETTREMLGSDNLNEIDLSELTIAVRKIADAYDKPLMDYDTEKSRASLDSLPIEKIISIAKAAEKMATVPQKK